MTPFKAGDRVEIIDDISHHYQSHVGIVINTQRRPMAVAVEVDARLADGTTHRFFDFQLRTPRATLAPIVFDSTMTPDVQGTRGTSDSRHLKFEAEGFDLHIRVTEKRTIRGQLTLDSNLPEQALLTLLIDDKPQQDTTADDLGEFAFAEVPRGNVSVEIFMPGRRIIAPIGL